MLAMIIFVSLILILILTLWVAFRSLSIAERTLAIFVICSSDVIVVMELAGLLGLFDSVAFILLIQLFISTGAVIAAWRIGFRISNFPLAIQEIFTEAKQWPSKLGTIPKIFFIVVILNYLLLAFLSVRFPQNVSDSLYNHLSRIGFWIQQSSLAHYNGFSIFGMIYPYNSSLLISPPIIFLKTAALVGLIQFSAAIFGALAIYLIATNLGFKQKGCILASLVFLTYPVIVFESITAQNDLLAACFNATAFAFLIIFIKKDRFIYLLLSAASIGLAIGTNQSGILILPGYLLLDLYMVIRNKDQFVKIIVRTVIYLSVSVLVLGSYSYIQNFVDYGNFVGPPGFLENVIGNAKSETFIGRIGLNSTRLFSQFISCDGLPTSFENRCITAKILVLRPILGKMIESERYLYGNNLFSLSTMNVQNSESAWYGLVSWLLILPSLLFGLVDSIRKKSFENLSVMLAAVSYFFAISLVKHGWDPYQGRYLITSVVLLQPFTAMIIEPKRKVRTLLTILICLMSAGSMVYSTINNANLPFVSKMQVWDLYTWGKSHSTLVWKIAEKIDASIKNPRNNKDVWHMSTEEIATLSDITNFPALTLVNGNVPSGSSVGIVSNTNLFFDFLFRGQEVRNRLIPLYANELEIANEDYVLIPITFDSRTLHGYMLIGTNDGWVLFKHVD